MENRPRRLLREISQQTGRNWAKRAGMIIVDDKIAATLTTFEDDLKTFSLIEQLLATSGPRTRLRLS